MKINILEKIQKSVNKTNIKDSLAKYDINEYHIEDHIKDNKSLRKYLSTILDSIIQDINNEYSKLNNTLNLSKNEYNTLLEYIYHIGKGIHTEYMYLDMFRKYNVIDLSKYIYEDNIGNVYKIGKQKAYVRWDSINNKSIYENIDHAIFPCGHSVEKKRVSINLHNCITCSVITGKSKASTGTQDFVSDLFKVGITNKTSSSGNYYSSGNYIHHYNTIEGIRTHKDKLIRNSECWSAGFAECSFYTDIRLPLTTLSKEFDVLTIDILDNKGDFVLFNIGIDNKCILYGLDRQYYTKFLIEVESDKVHTVKEALNYINPLSEYKEDSYVRHGSLFFLPTFREFNNFEKQHYVTLEKELNWHDENSLGELLHTELSKIYEDLFTYYSKYDKEKRKISSLDSIKFILSKITNDSTVFDKNSIVSGCYEKVLLNEADNKRLFETYTKTVNEFYNTIKAPKQLVRPNILDTRHTAQFKCIEDNNEYVKGYVYNGSNKRIFLPTWCKAYKSLAKSIWSV